MIITFVLLFHVFTICSTKGYENKAERFIVACHSTDFQCFKRQYYYIRNHVLLGSLEFEVPFYQPHKFEYSDTMTCVKITGVEESELVGIRYNGINKLFSMTITMPVRFQQEQWKNGSLPCQKPDKEFLPKGPHIGPLNKFSGNATLILTYPYLLQKKDDEVYMKMGEYNLDVILDIPDLSKYSEGNEIELRLLELSEWAYSIVRHIDLPEHIVIPYIEQIKKLYDKLPLERFILLYPSEDYVDLAINYSDDDIVQ